MTSIKEVSDDLLKTLFTDSRINKKNYTELEALLELEGALKFRIEQVKKELNIQ